MDVHPFYVYDDSGRQLCTLEHSKVSSPRHWCNILHLGSDACSSIDFSNRLCLGFNSRIRLVPWPQV